MLFVYQVISDAIRRHVRLSQYPNEDLPTWKGNQPGMFYGVFVGSDGVTVLGRWGVDFKEMQVNETAALLKLVDDRRREAARQCAAAEIVETG